MAKRALLYFLPLVCLVSGAFTGLYLIGSGTMAAEMQATSRHLLDKQAAALHIRLQTIGEDLRVLTTQATGNEADWRRWVQAVQQRRHTYRSINLLTADGENLFATTSKTPNDLRHWPLLQRVLASTPGEVCVAPLAADTGADRPRVRFAVRAPAQAGHPAAAIVADVWADTLLDNDNQHADVHISLLTAAGVQLAGAASHDESATSPFADAHPAAWERIARTGSGRMITEGGLYVFRTIDPAADVLETAGGGDPQASWKLVGRVPDWRLPTADRLRPLLFLSSLSVMLVLLAAGCWRLAHVSLVGAPSAIIDIAAMEIPTRSEMSDPDDSPRRTVAVARSEVILSDLAADPDMADLIDEFIASLPEMTSGMTDALLHGDFDQLKRTAHQLRGAGGGYGYPAITDAAGAVEDAATAEDIEMAILSMIILIATCQAVRRGRQAPVTT